MIETDRRKRVCSFLLACNLIFIWGNSLLPGDVSGAISDGFLDLARFFLRTIGEKGAGSGVVRKLAHFTEFTALGMLLSWLGGMLRKQKRWSLCWGIAAACVDETIQSFIPGRSPGLADVLIDISGVAAGMALVYLGHTLYRKYNISRGEG